MHHSDVVQLIIQLCQEEEDAGERIRLLQDRLGTWNVEKLSHHLGHVGVIPEMYGHDSSEEKLYAKYCDILIYAFFQLYGMESTLVRERGDSPDVIGILKGKYKIVADAKAFRLSRTALNPKDYKVDAVDQWKQAADANYACLVGSLFPKERSRLFQEAVDGGVTLLTYAQLQFIISDPKWTFIDLEPLWKISSSLASKNEINPGDYRNTLEKWLVSNIKSPISLKKTEMAYAKNIAEEGEKQIAYLEREKEKISSLPKEEMAKQLHSPIDKQISQIRSRISELLGSQNSQFDDFP
jgi:hypothetical protein